MREFHRELATFGRAKPITQADLDQWRIGVLRSLPEQFETIGAVGDREKIEGQVKDLV